MSPCPPGLTPMGCGKVGVGVDLPLPTKAIILPRLSLVNVVKISTFAPSLGQAGIFPEHQEGGIHLTRVKSMGIGENVILMVKH